MTGIDLSDKDIQTIIDSLADYRWNDDAAELLERLGKFDKYEPAFPLQPIEIAKDGVVRFKENRLVNYLLEAGPFDLNHLARLPDITQDESMQFAQLIGYSVSGFGDLSYAHRKVVAEADTIAYELTKDDDQDE